MHWLIVYSVDSEIDRAKFEAVRGADMEVGRINLLRTGGGKVRSAVEVNNYLNGALRANLPRPKVVCLGTAVSLVPGMNGKLLSPQWAVDRDAPDLDATRLECESFNNSGLTIGTGDGFVGSCAEAKRLREAGVSLVDMETQAVAWSTLRNFGGKVLTLRYVVDTMSPENIKDRGGNLTEARKLLTGALIQLTNQ